MADAQPFDRITSWMRGFPAAMAVFIAPSLAGRFTPHGGVSIRGVVTTEDLPAGRLIMSIPTSLWVTAENLRRHWAEEVYAAEASIDELPSCLALATAMGDEARAERRDAYSRLQDAVALALEPRSNASFLAPYLDALPSLEDYRSFHPALASEEVRAEWAALPLFRAVDVSRELDEECARCFGEWAAQDQARRVQAAAITQAQQEQPPPSQEQQPLPQEQQQPLEQWSALQMEQEAPEQLAQEPPPLESASAAGPPPLSVGALRWEEVQLALMRWRTRAYGGTLPGGQVREAALIPALDMLHGVLIGPVFAAALLASTAHLEADPSFLAACPTHEKPASHEAGSQRPGHRHQTGP